jgi:hypothetical protein
VMWNGRDARGREIASGIYFVRLRGAGATSIHKMTLAR